MKNIQEYLRKQAFLEKRYENSGTFLPNNSEYGIIGNINEAELVEDNVRLSFMSIDKFIQHSMVTSLYTDSPKGYWAHIDETLIKSHSVEKFIEALKKYFKDNIYNIDTPYDYKPKGDKTAAVKFKIGYSEIGQQLVKYARNRTYKNAEQHTIPEDLQKLLDFFNYYISSADEKNDGSVNVLCEPKFSDNVTKMVYDKYNGVLYHVTTSENVNRILHRGLQLHGNKNIYRYFEPRINFFLAANDKDLIKRAQNIRNQKNYEKDDSVVLKIDLNTGVKNHFTTGSYSLNFYHDSLYPVEWSVYTYGLVHPRFISVVDNKEVNTAQVVKSFCESKIRIDDDWLNNEKPVETADGRQVIVTKIDISKVPNIIKGQVKMKEELFEYEWQDDGTCIKALDQMGNPKKPDDADKLTKKI